MKIEIEICLQSLTQSQDVKLLSIILHLDRAKIYCILLGPITKTG